MSKDSDDAAIGGDKRYSFSSSSKSNFVDSDSEGEGNPFSYFDAAAAALKSPSRDSFISDDDARPTRKHDLLDVPVEGTRVLATFGRDRDDVEETIVFDPPSPNKRAGSHRANQEYYDVLEMASNRLRQDSSSVLENDMEIVSSGDEAVRKKKKKKKKNYKNMLSGMMEATGPRDAEKEKESIQKVTGGGAFVKIDKI
mmetsp:Transcript_6756/g.15393  ORF Transcript_6756/g.15393 Transcript_6756/m.15393 type:complete len:198 (+) Transcript_6756:93-686(+)